MTTPFVKAKCKLSSAIIRLYSPGQNI